MKFSVTRQIGSLEGMLAIANAVIVGWLFGLGGNQQVGDFIHRFVSPAVGLGLRPDDAFAWAHVISLPFLLPVGVFGLATSAAYIKSWGIVAATWMWYGVNAVLWGEAIAFLYRLIKSGRFRYAQDEAFRWTKNRPHRDPNAPPKKSRRARRSRGLE